MRTGDSFSVAGEEIKLELLFSTQSTAFLAILSPTHSLGSPESASVNFHANASHSPSVTKKSNEMPIG